MARVKDITGMRFGRLVALEPVGKNSRGRTLWLCRCDCSNIRTINGTNLRCNVTRSCGCLVKENRGGPPKHGHAARGEEHPLYRTWVAMRARCNDPNHLHFKYYGGRGIKVCERWDDFPKFLSDVGERPPGKVLDRIDNDGNYEPGNIRWVTPKELIKNRRPQQVRRDSCSGIKGVYKNGSRWQAAVYYNGKTHYIKTFDTPQEAARAYQYIAKRLHCPGAAPASQSSTGVTP